MTLHADPIEPRSAVARRSPGKAVVAWATTTDHQTIGSLLFFLLGGVRALFMRAELARPGTQLLVGFHLTFLVQHWLGAEGSDVIDVEEGTPNRDLGGPERS